MRTKQCRARHVDNCSQIVDFERRGAVLVGLDSYEKRGEIELAAPHVDRLSGIA
jgi:hypothetical protein